MAEIRLNYTADQINTLLNKISSGEVLTSSEKTRLLNINLDEYVKDDYNLTLKIQEEISKSGGYVSLKNTTSKVSLGRYIIRYNDLENTLDFSYTENDVILVNYEIGSIDGSTGNDLANTSCIRTVGRVEVDPTRSYSLYFLKPATSVRYYLYRSDGAFIKSSTETTVSSDDIIKIETTSDTAYLRFKFSAPEQTVAAAFALADYIDLYKSIGTEVSNSTYEQGSLNTTTGLIEDNTETIRSKDYIALESNNRYIVTTPEALKYFRFYFYDSSKGFISCSDSLIIAAGGSAEIIPPDGAQYMKIKFATSDSVPATALNMSNKLTITKSVVESFVLKWVQGEYDAYGVSIASTACVRTENPITLETGYQYVITFPNKVLWFRYYFYTSSGAFISRSDSVDVYANTPVTITPPTNAATMAIKFGAEGSDWQTALTISANITFKKVAK